ncbi:MAG: EB domain-containing protein, partial [Hyphomicrobiales bacterium]|nr:EB domain-containing protein [Hyphomicrobiales bacterium]
MRQSYCGPAFRFWLPVVAFFLAFHLTSAPTAALPLSGIAQAFDPGSATKLAQYYVPYYRPPPPRWKKKRKRRRPTPRRRVTKPKCAHPWAYSAGLRRCICVAEGYSLANGKCTKLANLCSANGHWDRERKSCQCAEGFVLKDGRCVDPQLETASADPVEGAQCLWPEVLNEDKKTCGCAPGYKEQGGRCLGETGSEENKQAQALGSDGLLTTEIALIQQCLNEAGYLSGRIAARMTKRAWTAYWFFKQDYKIGSTPKGVHDAGAQQKLFELCPLAARAVRGTKYAALQSGAGQEATLPADPEFGPYKPQPAPKVYAKPEAECLPEQLYGLIVKSYGNRSSLKRCTQTCIAVPRGLSARDIAQAQRRGVRWCRSCLEVSSHLPLDDILKIERASNVQICTRPPARLPRWKRADGAPRVAYTKVRRLYRTLPTATDHGSDIAVIIGNKNYQGGLPANESAHSNAGAMYALLTEHLGFD